MSGSTDQTRVDLQQGVTSTLTMAWAPDGTQADVGNVTIGIVDANGTEVVAPGTVTAESGTGTSTVYTYALAAQANLTRLTATWTRTSGITRVTFLEVFGSQLFTEIDARTSKIVGGLTPFSDDTKYSDADLASWRLQIQDQFESKTRRSWVRRYARVTVAADHSYTLRPFGGRAVDWGGRRLAGEGRYTDIIRIISATDHGTVIDVDDLVIDGRLLHLTSGAWQTSSRVSPLSVVLEYEYGVDPPDSEAHQRALEMLHANASPSHGPDNLDSWSNDSGSHSVGPEGWSWPTKVWEWGNREQYHRLPGFA